MTQEQKSTSAVEQYANLIPMREIDSNADQLFPFPIFNDLRQKSPVRYDESRSCWDVFRYEDVHFILKNPKMFSSERGSGTLQGSILTMDPPRHTKMRNLVNKAFTPKAVKDLTNKIEEVTLYLLDQVKEKGTMDLVHDVAGPLPVIIIAELLGIPTKDRDLFKTYSDVLVEGAKDNSSEAFQRMTQKRKEGNEFLKEYFKKIIKERTNNPEEDLISLLIEAKIDGEKLTEEELLSFCVLLLVAGNETTTNLITNAVRYMTEDKKIQEQARTNLPLIPKLVEETLRFYPPIQAIGRIAKEHVKVGGKTIQKGEQVICWVASANRDEQKFAEPNRFTLERKLNPHLSFGFGIHFCLGAPLARLEAEVALVTLLSTFSKLEDVKGTKLEAIPSPFVFGVKSLPLKFTR
ncbi:cytochrome P450 [Peribacillus simplex]|uniref:Cytochrome P450 n=1 Tax=Peribacillus simplex TaxID=1478 RepID=A0AAW7IV33_9BACI|nr:cytochrome P450 [Peribacillus simplex]AMM92663.1 cytochrome P450 [Peribacillus simplex]MDM5295247.1 cytochrome P450 [Peribacillus simplex]MDM5454213.1 cytochrome P450 [Peribacillus simplex]